jgi:hypothetical protein
MVKKRIKLIKAKPRIYEDMVFSMVLKCTTEKGMSVPEIAKMLTTYDCGYNVIPKIPQAMDEFKTIQRHINNMIVDRATCNQRLEKTDSIFIYKMKKYPRYRFKSRSHGKRA